MLAIHFVEGAIHTVTWISGHDNLTGPENMKFSEYRLAAAFATTSIILVKDQKETPCFGK